MTDTKHTGPLPDPGWYPDKNGAARWWDGTQWSNRVRLPQDAPSQLAPAAAKNNSTLLLFGWLTAFLVPFVGFVLGIIAVAKSEMQGIGIMLVSIIMFFIWPMLLFAA
jgi:hypothetical protein